MLSYCTVCDTDTNPCPSHVGAARYLDPVIYEQNVEHGWSVPAAERDDWSRRPLPVEKRALRFDAEARPLQQLVVELEARLFLSDPLEAIVRAAYAANPLRTTRLVEKVVAGAREQSLGNAEGFLAKHATSIAARNGAAA